MEEIWKDIEGYEGLYQVSNLGQVRSLDRYVTRIQWRSRQPVEHLIKGQIIKPSVLNTGYLRIALSDGHRNYKGFLVHRLVGAAFVSNPHNYEFINHKNEDKLDNRADNLEWCTRIYNTNYGTGKMRMGAAHRRPVLQCDLQWNVIREWPSIREAAKHFGVTKASIGNICGGHSTIKTCKGFRWKYKE